MDKIRYGHDHAQFGELTRPTGRSKGVVVVIHGGFWRAAYDLSLGRPLAASLVEHGWTAYNLEYRRVGNGGGYPKTLDDIAAGIDALAAVDGLDTSTVMTLGHSAGGHLAVWAAGRPKLDRYAVGQARRAGHRRDRPGRRAGPPCRGSPRQRGGEGIHGRARGHHAGRPDCTDPARRTGALRPQRCRRHRADQPGSQVCRTGEGGRRGCRAHRGRG